MYIISNKQMEDIIKYVETWEESVQLKDCSAKIYNSVRLARILLKRLKAKQPFSKSELSEELRKYL